MGAGAAGWLDPGFGLGESAGVSEAMGSDPNDPWYSKWANQATGGFVATATKDPKTTQRSGLTLSAESEMERRARENMFGDYNKLRDMAARGPGEGDVDYAYSAQRSLAKMLEQYAADGGAPTDEDIAASNSLAAKLFQGQRVAMGQAFEDQLTAANRQAALMGREVNDPILRAKLAQEQTRQSALLEANQGSYAAQLAQQNPMRRLSFATDRTNILSGLATQAMANRQALMAMGSGISENERSFRLNTAERWGTAQTKDPGRFWKTALGATGTMLGFMGGGMGGGAMAGGGAAQGGGAPAPQMGQLSGYNYGQSPQQFFGMQGYGQAGVQSTQNPFMMGAQTNYSLFGGR